MTTLVLHEGALYHADDFSDDYLAHYGVKGMKWGVRRARTSISKGVKRGKRYVKSADFKRKATQAGILGGGIAGAAYGLKKGNSFALSAGLSTAVGMGRMMRNDRYAKKKLNPSLSGKDFDKMTRKHLGVGVSSEKYARRVNENLNKGMSRRQAEADAKKRVVRSRNAKVAAGAALGAAYLYGQRNPQALGKAVKSGLRGAQKLSNTRAATSAYKGARKAGGAAFRTAKRGGAAFTSASKNVRNASGAPKRAYNAARRRRDDRRGVYNLNASYSRFKG